MYYNYELMVYALALLCIVAGQFAVFCLVMYIILCVCMEVYYNYIYIYI